MPQTNDRIHGYNAVYRNDAEVIIPANLVRFYSFDFEQKGARWSPSNFKYHSVVQIPAAVPVVQDHQGHIVPQNILTIIFDRLIEMGLDEEAELREINQFIQAHGHTYPWLQNVVDYLTGIVAVPITAADIYSVVMWNPINICRAPEDVKRGNPPIPKNDVDVQVIAYLQNDRNGANTLQLLNYDNWLGALYVLRDSFPQGGDFSNPTEDQVEAVNNYISACSETLEAQRQEGMGYYAFPWQNVGGFLQPNGFPF